MRGERAREGGTSMVSSEGWFVGVLTSICHSNGHIESSEGGEERGEDTKCGGGAGVRDERGGEEESSMVVVREWEEVERGIVW